MCVRLSLVRQREREDGAREGPVAMASTSVLSLSVLSVAMAERGVGTQAWEDRGRREARWHAWHPRREDAAASVMLMSAAPAHRLLRMDVAHDS